LIHPIHVVDEKGMLRVVQARQQLQVSGDGGLNEIPIKVATKTVREVSTACCWGGTYTLLFVIIHYSVKFEPILPSIFALLLRQEDDIDSIEVVDDNKMLLGNFQAQVSGDGGLNDNPIKVATTTVREVSTACCWGGHTLFCL
jgi:hypothetical protein